MPNEYLILLVEDTPHHAELVIKILMHYGYKVDWKKNGAEAFEYSRQQLPSLFLIDIDLPDMDGVELLQKLRLYCSSHLPMIAITAHSMAETKNKMLALGFDDYLSKPFKIEELMNKIKTHLPNHG